MSIPLGISARAPRGSGLKKPRPLRSTSLQESSKENHSDLNVTFQRQQSDGSQSREVTTKQPVVVCKEIAALSARLVSEVAAENVEEDSGYDTQPYNDPHYTHASKLYNRSTSLNSEETRPHSTKPYIDINSNNVSSTSILAKGSGGKEQRRVRWCISEDLSESKPALSDLDQLNLYSNNYSIPSSSEKQQKSKGEKISLATLVTDSGEDLVLTGRNMKTILCASRVLLREMKAKIVRIEEIPDSDPRLNISSPKSSVTDELSPENTALPDSPTSTSAPQFFPQSQPSHKYSKHELLEISRSVGSRQPPALWNVLSITCGDICLPSEMVKDYFDPDFFVHHDGALIRASQGTGLGVPDPNQKPRSDHM